MTILGWSPLFDAFIERQLPLVPSDRRVAAFDADGTLWAGDVGDMLFERLAEIGWLSPLGAEPERNASEWNAEYARRRQKDPADAYGWCCRVMHGLRPDALQGRLDEWLDAFFGQAENRREGLWATMRALEQQGWSVWVVSASNEWLVERAVSRLGLQDARVIGVSLEVDAGVWTDRLAAEVSQGAGKVNRLRGVGVNDLGLAMGNTMGDFELLALADPLPVAVAPDAALYRAAMSRGWPCVWPDGPPPAAP